MSDRFSCLLNFIQMECVESCVCVRLCLILVECHFYGKLEITRDGICYLNLIFRLVLFRWFFVSFPLLE